jgi:hypothetical protein
MGILTPRLRNHEAIERARCACEGEVVAREPIPFRVLLDDEPPGTSHGADVDEDGYGLLREGRL